MTEEKQKIVREYLKNLEVGDADRMLRLFSKDAVVVSPLRGTIDATKFYEDLFSDTTSSKIHLKNILFGENPQIVAGHFQYDWILSDGTSATFECIDLFEFNDKKLITKLIIIYDTHQIREKYEKVRTTR